MFPIIRRAFHKLETFLYPVLALHIPVCCANSASNVTVQPFKISA